MSFFNCLKVVNSFEFAIIIIIDLSLGIGIDVLQRLRFG